MYMIPAAYKKTPPPAVTKQTTSFFVTEPKNTWTRCSGIIAVCVLKMIASTSINLHIRLCVLDPRVNMKISISRLCSLFPDYVCFVNLFMPPSAFSAALYDAPLGILQSLCDWCMGWVVPFAFLRLNSEHTMNWLNVWNCSSTKGILFWYQIYSIAWIIVRKQ